MKSKQSLRCVCYVASFCRKDFHRSFIWFCATEMTEPLYCYEPTGRSSSSHDCQARKIQLTLSQKKHLEKGTNLNKNTLKLRWFWIRFSLSVFHTLFVENLNACKDLLTVFRMFLQTQFCGKCFSFTIITFSKWKVYTFRVAQCYTTTPTVRIYSHL